MRVGGRAEWLLEPSHPEELVRAWVAARERGIFPRVLGGGANLVVDDGELPGVVISTLRMRRVFRPSAGAADNALDPELSGARAPESRESDPRLVAWCGATMPSLVQAAAKLGWSGLEGLVGVPGNLGGGVAMNAGGRWGDMWDVIESVRVLDEHGELRDLPKSECSPRYRDGNLGGRMVVGAVLRLEVAELADVRERTREYLLEKKRVQPVTEKSAGCIFKNPDASKSAGRSAGKLIEDCGGKGLARGDAVVSDVHANFIVNRGAATASEVLALIEDVRERVVQKSGIRLETEVKIWRAGEARKR